MANEKKKKKHFFKDLKAELKKVIWPTPKQLINGTIAVITIVAVTATLVFALDLIFRTMNNYGVDKIKEQVQKNNTAVETEAEDETSSEAEGEEQSGETPEDGTTSDES